jgi:hypothetical protein
MMIWGALDVRTSNGLRDEAQRSLSEAFECPYQV